MLIITKPIIGLLIMAAAAFGEPDGLWKEGIANSCHTGYSKINSIEGCRTAVEALYSGEFYSGEYSFDTEMDENYPKGCYMWKDYKEYEGYFLHFYFNGANIGSEERDSTPICGKVPATPESTGNPTPGPTTSPSPGPTTNPSPGPTTNPSPRPTTNPSPGPTTNPSPGPNANPSPRPTSGTMEMVLKELKDLRAENSKEFSEVKDLINQRGQASSCMLGRRSKRSEP